MAVMGQIRGGNGSGGGNLIMKEVLLLSYTYGGSMTYRDENTVSNTETTGNWSGGSATYSGNYIKAANRASSGFKFTISALQAGTYYIHAVIDSTVIIDSTHKVSSAQDLEVYDSSTTSGTLKIYIVALA